MSDILALVWSRADAGEPVYSGDEFQQNKREFSELVRAKLIRQIDNASSVVCDACGEGHLEEVVFIENPPKSGMRAFIHCPDNGCIQVPFERIQCWAIDFNFLGAAISAGLVLAGAKEELSPERIWLLGKGTFAGQSREIFLARGLTWADAPSVVGATARLQSASSHIVLVAGSVPPASIWQGDIPRVIPVSILAHLTHGKFSMDRSHLISQLSEGKRKKATVVPMQSFPTPPGTGWADVRIKIAEHRLLIEAKGKTKEYSFQEAGFEEKRRKNIPDSIWTILGVLASRVGILSKQDAKLADKTRINLKRYISVLRTRVQEFIPNIDGDPISYNSEKCSYETAFAISTDETPRIRAPQGITWEGVSIAEIGTSTISISFRSAKTYAAPQYEEDETMPTLEAAEKEATYEQEFDLANIGLANNKGVPNSKGKALMEVLENKGIIQRDSDDAPMLELGNFLCNLIGINEPAFDYNQNTSEWVTQFEASSEMPKKTPRR